MKVVVSCLNDVENSKGSKGFGEREKERREKEERKRKSVFRACSGF